MPSDRDRKDSAATWQSPQVSKPPGTPTDSTWEPPDDDASLDQDEPFDDPQNANAQHSSPDDQLEDQTASPTSMSSMLWKQLGHYFSLIIIPFLFAGLTSLIVIPLVLTNRAKLPPQGLIPLIILLLLIAVAQGVAIYYAGTNNGLWGVCTLAGFFLFVLVGCFAIFGPGTGFALLAILVGISILLFRFYVRSVPEEHVSIVQAFGQYKRTLYPGFNILLPWEKVSRQLSTRKTMWPTPMQRVEMSQDQDVVLRGTITYQLQPEYAHLALNVTKWEQSLQNHFIISMQDLASNFTPDDFLPWPQGPRNHPSTQNGATPLTEGEPRWQQVNNFLLQQVQDSVAPWGVLINAVRIYDIALVQHNASPLNATTDPTSYSRQQTQAMPSSPQQPKGTAQAASQTTRETPKRAEQPFPQGASSSSTSTDSPPATVKEDTLVKAYKEVQSGKIKDPETIRNLADRFDAISRDSVQSQSVSFDATRAALNLYAEALRREEELAAGTPFNDETKPNWTIRRPTDENLMAGG